MAETYYAESNALLALIRGDEDDASEIIDGFLPGERRALTEAARKLATMSDDRVSRCGGCGIRIEGGERTVSTSFIGGGYQTWHEGCRP